MSWWHSRGTERQSTAMGGHHLCAQAARVLRPEATLQRGASAYRERLGLLIPRHVRAVDPERDQVECREARVHVRCAKHMSLNGVILRQEGAGIRVVTTFLEGHAEVHRGHKRIRVFGAEPSALVLKIRSVQRFGLPQLGLVQQRTAQVHGTDENRWVSLSQQPRACREDGPILRLRLGVAALRERSTRELHSRRERIMVLVPEHAPLIVKECHVQSLGGRRLSLGFQQHPKVHARAKRVPVLRPVHHGGGLEVGPHHRFRLRVQAARRKRGAQGHSSGEALGIVQWKLIRATAPLARHDELVSPRVRQPARQAQLPRAPRLCALLLRGRCPHGAGRMNHMRCASAPAAHRQQLRLGRWLQTNVACRRRCDQILWLHCDRARRGQVWQEHCDSSGWWPFGGVRLNDATLAVEGRVAT